MLNNLNLERLVTFVAVAQAPTFAAAAKSRAVTVSAISQQIRTLEGELGHPLFERVGRRARLTQEGQGLLEAIAPLLGAIDEAIGQWDRGRTTVEGTVSIGAPRTFGHRWLEPRIPKLLAHAPRLQVVLRFEIPSVLERELLDGKLDLAIIARAPELPGISGERIAEEQFVAIAPKGGSPKWKRTSTEIEALALPWIVFARDRPMHDAWWKSTFGKIKPLTPICEAPSLELMLALVEQGVGATVLPDYLVDPAIRAGRVVRLSIPERKTAGNSIHLIWRTSHVRNARFEATREALRR
jgi:DNA-binding transcriptional LysR family regulator